MDATFRNKIEEITDGFLVVIIAAKTQTSPHIKQNYEKNQDFLNIISSLALEKRIILRKMLLKEVEKISEAIAEEINEFTTCSKH